jgi:hypothetical protein
MRCIQGVPASAGNIFGLVANEARWRLCLDLPQLPRIFPECARKIVAVRFDEVVRCLSLVGSSG